MSETKHTPGPWAHGGCVVYGADGDSVADLSLNGRRHPNVTEANTRLVAAAPDLLDALEALLSNPVLNLGDLVYYVREREGEDWDGPAVKAWGDAVQAAKAAIAKAKGGS